MEKNLRSLIHEKFPLDLRVQIDLLSRRRDIRNKEKQEELLKLLRANNIEGVVPLGPGTNRYAFKLDGFVVKVATDNDGKIDNLKEFKMAKRLYPHVTKVYEVSENGTLLVAQYIQPFDSFAEMCKYADEIRKILTDLSSVYLIGDVGITSTNYSNWGLPIGSDKPVCLDFAYVYEVSSELFICRHCKANAMIVPNKDFTELYCSNPACGKKYLFEDIRARIGNDLHRHEIGDLKDEGYALLRSNTKTELNEQRSNYLIRKKEKEDNESKAEQKEEIIYDSFEMEHSPKYYIMKEENVMSNILTNATAIAATLDDGNMGSNRAIHIKAKSVKIGNINDNTPVDDMHDNIPVVKASVIVSEKKSDPIQDKSCGVVFSGKIESSPQLKSDDQQHSENETENTEEPINEDSQGLSEESDTAVHHPIETSSMEESQDKSEDDETMEDETEFKDSKVETTEIFPESFLKNAHKAVSILSNVIANELHSRAVFDEVKNNISDKKMYPETFYKCVQNVIFRSLMVFLNFTETDEPNTNNNGTHKVFIIPKEIYGTEYESTMTFISRLWSEHLLKDVEDAEAVIEKYYDLFGSSALTIQPKWLYIFKDRIKTKMHINVNGINKLADLIEEVWCIVPDDESEEDDSMEEEILMNETDTEEAVTESVQEETVEYSKEDVEVSMHVHEEVEAMTAITEENMMDSLVGTHAIDQNIDQNDNADESESTEENTEEDEEYEENIQKFISVDIFYEDDFDVIKVNSGDAFGDISIPFYAKMDEIDTNSQETPSFADDRNGMWDWLIHMVPDLMFTTSNPDKWLEINNEDFGEDDEYNNIKIVILDETNGVYTMGIYYIEGIYIVDDEYQRHSVNDIEIFNKINRLIKDNIAYANISHLRRSLTMTELIYDESYIQLSIDNSEETAKSVDPVTTETANISDAEQAAIDAMLGINENLEEQPQEESVEENTSESQEDEYVPPTIAVEVADRYLAIIGTDEGYEYTIYDEEYNEIDGGIYDNNNVSIKELLNILLIELKSSLDPVVKGSVTNTSGHQIISYDELNLKVAIKKEKDSENQYVDESTNETESEEVEIAERSIDESPTEGDGILHPIRRKHQ